VITKRDQEGTPARHSSEGWNPVLTLIASSNVARMQRKRNPGSASVRRSPDFAADAAALLMPGKALMGRHPAKAGIQFSFNSSKKLDSSLRWNDEQRLFKLP